ncbi:MAG TPA: hypothetical protein VFP70_05990 [Burkholderiales bacterium]|nr:hypothetical protein [Burkholderiales bacterium]
MKIVIWSVCAVLLAVWTGFAFLSVEITEWIAQASVTSEMTELKSLAQQMPVPEWLPVWIDPAWVEALQAMLMSSIDLIASGFPYFSAAAGWLVPVIWAVWAAGALVLLLLAGGGHFLVGVLRSGTAKA